MSMQGDYKGRKFDFIVNWIASWIGKETRKKPYVKELL
jgi:hypothetical protein